MIKHALTYSSFMENITHGHILHLGKSLSWISHTVFLSSKLISNWTREQRDRHVRVSTPEEWRKSYSQQNRKKGRRAPLAAEMSGLVFFVFLTDHRNFKQQINHATWGDQTDLNTYEVNDFIKVLKVSVWRCWVKHITGKKQETYLSISERHNLWKGNLA